jgi:hypothetical protein
MAVSVGDDLNYLPSESEKQTDHCAKRPFALIFTLFIPAGREPGEGAADSERTCRPQLLDARGACLRYCKTCHLKESLSCLPP